MKGTPKSKITHKELVNEIRQIASKAFGDEAILRSKNYAAMKIRKGECPYEANPRIAENTALRDAVMAQPNRDELIEEYGRLLAEHMRLIKWVWPFGGKDSDQYYTPSKYIESARNVMGSIDCDPASNDYANEHLVKAPVYYTANNTGLNKPWKGNVWINPPYSEVVLKFFNKLAKEHRAGRCKQAMVLWHTISRGSRASKVIESISSAKCYTDHKIEFERPNGEKVALPIQNIFFYMGKRAKQFEKEFRKWGDVVLR